MKRVLPRRAVSPPGGTGDPSDRAGCPGKGAAGDERFGRGTARIMTVRVRGLLVLAMTFGAVLAPGLSGTGDATTPHLWAQAFAFANGQVGVIVEGSGVSPGNASQRGS